MSDQKRKEDCRREVRGWLAERQALAHPAERIARGINREGNDFDLKEINDAVVFLVGRKHVEVEPDGDGSTLYYKITSEGVLFHERGAR